MNIDIERGLTRLYLLFWATWLVYLALRLTSFIGDWMRALVEVGLVGVVIPWVLLLALKWVGAGFRSSPGRAQ